MTALMTIRDATEILQPPITRRELSRLLQDVPPSGIRYTGGAGRRPRTYPLTVIMQAHAEWVRQKAPQLPTVDQPCQNADGQRCAR